MNRQEMIEKIAPFLRAKQVLSSSDSALKPFYIKARHAVLATGVLFLAAACVPGNSGRSRIQILKQPNQMGQEFNKTLMPNYDGNNPQTMALAGRILGLTVVSRPVAAVQGIGMAPGGGPGGAVSIGLNVLIGDQNDPAQAYAISATNPMVDGSRLVRANSVGGTPSSGMAPSAEIAIEAPNSSVGSAALYRLRVFCTVADCSRATILIKEQVRIDRLNAASESLVPSASAGDSAELDGGTGATYRVVMLGLVRGVSDANGTTEMRLENAPLVSVAGSSGLNQINAKGGRSQIMGGAPAPARILPFTEGANQFVAQGGVIKPTPSQAATQEGSSAGGTGGNKQGGKPAAGADQPGDQGAEADGGSSNNSGQDGAKGAGGKSGAPESGGGNSGTDEAEEIKPPQ